MTGYSPLTIVKALQNRQTTRLLHLLILFTLQTTAQIEHYNTQVVIQSTTSFDEFSSGFTKEVIGFILVQTSTDFASNDPFKAQTDQAEPAYHPPGYPHHRTQGGGERRPADTSR